MKNKLVFSSGITITDSNIRGGVKYTQNINPNTDFTIGCASSAEIVFDYDNRNNDVSQYVEDGVFNYYIQQANDTDWRLIGKFYIQSSEVKKNLITIRAYDAMIKTEAYIDSFIDGLTFPLTTTSLFTKLCSFLGVSCGGIDPGLVNTTFKIQDNFQAINITGRQVIQYIAEACAGYAVADTNGAICIKDYEFVNTELNNSNYVSYTKANYKVDRVEGLTIRTTQDDIGVSQGATEGNIYIIQNNPLFYAENDSQLRNVSYNLYQKILIMNGYVPASLNLLQDFGLKCGQIFKINGNRFILMKKEITASGTTFECYGNKQREKQESNLNSEIIALRGKTNELYRDLEQTKSTLTDTANGLKSQITQTASEIRSEINNTKDGLQSNIDQTASSIRTEISDTKKGLESKIEQTADGINTTVSSQGQQITQLQQTTNSISSTVSNQGQTITEIKQDLDGISLTYNSTNGTASITIGDVTVSKLVDGNYVDKAVAGINLNGYVQFTDLSTPGSTTISGSNITTGTISADRINMTGAITWSDLSTSVKNTINNAGGLDEDEVTTLITDQLVSSPNIQGANYWSEDRNTHMDLLDASSVSAGIGGGIEVTGGSTQIFKACRSALLNVTLTSYGTDFLQITSNGSVRPLGNWDFSSATVSGLNLSGDITVKAVWGA